jgi:hypothetical protein
MRANALVVALLGLTAGGTRYDVVIRGGTVYDGGGATPMLVDRLIQWGFHRRRLGLRSRDQFRITLHSISHIRTRRACATCSSTGVQVLANGEHAGALPGRVVRGPGWLGRKTTPEETTK